MKAQEYENNRNSSELEHQICVKIDQIIIRKKKIEIVIYQKVAEIQMARIRWNANLTLITILYCTDSAKNIVDFVCWEA